VTSLPRLPRTTALLEQGIDRAGYVGVQLHVWTTDGPVVDLAIGSASDGQPLTDCTVVRWLSGTKPIIAVAVAQLWEKGKLALDDSVTRYINEFQRDNRPDVTLRHLLTHTAGFRDDPPRGALAQPWEQAVRTACESELEEGWIPGQMATYSTWTAFLLLGEVVRRVDGRRIDQYVREEVFLPLGMEDCFLSMSPATYNAYRGRLADLAYVTPDGPLPDPLLNDERLAAHCWPALGARGPARQIARMYRSLLPRGEADVGRILSPPTVEAITARHQRGIRYTRFLKDVCWGLGMLSGPEMFGPYCSSRTFGGRGHGSSVALADGTHQLVVAAAWTGMLQDENQHGGRVRALTAAIYEDLNLALRVRRPASRSQATLAGPTAAQLQPEGEQAPTRASPLGTDRLLRRDSKGPADHTLQRLLQMARGRTEGEMVALLEAVGGPGQLLQFFRDALSTAIRRDEAKPGTVAFLLNWQGKDIAYSVTINEDATVLLREGAIHSARLTMITTGYDFARLLVGDLDAKSALASGRLRLAGDLSFVGTWLRAFGGSPFAIGTP
jgi:CubicO group peptidase (beta-lactamase class C family)